MSNASARACRRHVNAVNEAKKLGVPVIAMVDTNANPAGIDYVIPANDDAIKGIKLILDYVVAAIEEGKAVADKKEGTPSAASSAKAIEAKKATEVKK